MQTREAHRLEEICEKLPDLTGLRWRVLSVATRTELRSYPERNVHYIKFIEEKILNTYIFREPRFSDHAAVAVEYAVRF